MKKESGLFAGCSRRTFIKGSVAFGFAGGIFRATGGLSPSGPLRLKFGVVSDVHISTSDTTYFTRALQYFRDQSVDAVMICGDIADGGKIAQLETAANAYFAVFPNDQLPNGDHVERLIVCGNHDYRWGTNITSDDTMLRSDFANNWKTIWGDDSFSKIWQKTVKGYTFIGNHWASDTSACGHRVPVFADLPAYLQEHAAELTGTKPFFYLQHSQQSGTCFGDRAWGEDTGETTTALKAFPNAVTFSGHSHFSLTDDRSIWQDGFTAVNAGSLTYTGLDDADNSSIRGYENGYSGSAKAMAQYARQDGKQGMIVSVYDDMIVYHRLEFYGTTPRQLGDDWVQLLPTVGDATDPYNYTTRSAALTPPRFPSAARLRAGSVDAVTRGNSEIGAVRVSFTAANAGGMRPIAYEIAFIGDTTVTREVLAQGFNMPLSDSRASGDSYAVIANSDLPSGDTITISVTPLSAYRTRGTALSRTFDGAALRGGTLLADGLSVVGY